MVLINICLFIFLIFKLNLIFKWIIVVFMCLHFIFWLCPMAYGACGILVPWPGIKSMLPALAEWSLLSNGPPGKSYSICFFNRWAQTRTNQFFKFPKLWYLHLGTGSKCKFSDLPPKDWISHLDSATHNCTSPLMHAKARGLPVYTTLSTRPQGRDWQDSYQLRSLSNYLYLYT